MFTLISSGIYTILHCMVLLAGLAGQTVSESLASETNSAPALFYLSWAMYVFQLESVSMYTCIRFDEENYQHS